MNHVFKWARIAGAVLALVVVLGAVLNALGEFRAAGDSDPVEAEAIDSVDDGADGASASEVDTASVEPEAEDEYLGTVTVVIDGLNFRQEPNASAALIRGLRDGDVLEYLGGDDGWYHVRDDDGVEGYVSASEQYTTLELK